MADLIRETAPDRSGGVIGFDGEVVGFSCLEAAECVAGLLADIDAVGVVTADLPIVELITTDCGFGVGVPGQGDLAGLGGGRHFRGLSGGDAPVQEESSNK